MVEHFFKLFYFLEEFCPNCLSDGQSNPHATNQMTSQKPSENARQRKLTTAFFYAPNTLSKIDVKDFNTIALHVVHVHITILRFML